MDIDEQGQIVDDEKSGRQIIIPDQVLPDVIQILPQDHRPFFPGQAIPVVMNAKIWLSTLEAVREHKQDVVGVIATRRSTDALPGPGDLYDMGTLCRIHRIHREDDQLQVLLEGIQRFKIQRWAKADIPLAVVAQYFPDRSHAKTEEEKAYAVAIINIIKDLIPLNPLYGEELKIFLARSNPNEPSVLADFAASLTTSSKRELQEVLETLGLQRRMEKVVELLNRELQIAKAQQEIRDHVEQEVQGRQREAFLKEQLKYIQQELGITKDDKTAESEEFKKRLEALTVPEAAQKKIDEELNKLNLLELGSPEFAQTRNYLDWITGLPWGLYSPDAQNLQQATLALAKHHEGLKDVKERILEFIALGIMKQEIAGSIICFVGPPGVGKTSLGRAVAEALERKFYRFSVGGLRDEAEIKGHRRTYIGAMPGKLLQALKDTGVANPVIMLDEIDKMGASYQGDPASALLEVLDPEQNLSFQDHYLGLPFDLSKVLFICTANQLDTIPSALLDRMEVIHLPGYLDSEKLSIARKHLLPRQLRQAGLRQRGDVRIDTLALKSVIEGYAREAGVRRLDKAIATIIRKAVVRLLGKEKRPIHIKRSNIKDYLGEPRFRLEPLQRGVGVVTGLAWTAAGGATLPIEATEVHRRQAGIMLTGQLGEVMQESANIALSYISGCAEQFKFNKDFFEQAFIHVHVPAGATPKDGPSAGISMASALLSLALGRAPRAGFAMTGELTLTGQVYPVGGIKEKLLSAKRQKIKKVILPVANAADVTEVPEHIKTGIKIHFVEQFPDVARILFGR